MIVVFIKIAVLIVQKEAIFYAWDLMTRVFKIPKDRLYVTYFGGEKKNGLEPDEDARQIWIETGYATLVQNFVYYMYITYVPVVSMIVCLVNPR